MNETSKFTIVTGVNEGYYHENESKEIIEIISEVWQRIAEEEYEKTDVYISAIFNKGKAVYSQKWGCPKGGEDIVVISGIRNDEFMSDDIRWRESVIVLAKKLKRKLRQTTMTCEFSEVKYLYFKE